MNDVPVGRHQISRVRRETRRRKVTVAGVEFLTPRMRRIRFASPELHDFASDAPDDHVKLFLPTAVAQADGGHFCMRDYTPREFDAGQGVLTIDFALHEAGPATAWALAARVGDRLEIGGPRGSMMVADDFDWYLLVGDETALPAIGRRVEALRAGVPVTTVVVVDGAAERQDFATAAAWRPAWVERDGAADDAALLREAVGGALLAGDGYVWIAAEARVARALRDYIVERLGHPKAWVKAAGYWTEGQANVHETIQD